MANTDNYTDKNTWEKYWENYKPLPINKSSIYQALFDKIPDGQQIKKFIEIGGFPGNLSVYFTKYKNYKSSFLDFFVSQNVFEKVLAINHLNKNEIETIEGDFFTFNSNNLYDVVFSLGFIEHFEDTQNVINKHIELLNKDGHLLILLPNLKGINGWIQRVFDIKNYNIHNIKSMDIDLIYSIASKNNLKNIEVGYFGKPMVWLEPTAPVNKLTRMLVKWFSLALKLIPIKGIALSPYIYLYAIKK